MLGVAIEQRMTDVDVGQSSETAEVTSFSNRRRSTSFSDAVARPPPTASDAGSVRS